MILDDFLPYILPHAKDCPSVIATFNTRLAIIELCREALIWREYQTPVLTVLNQTAYAYGLAAGQQMCTFLSVTLDGLEIDLVDPRIGKARDLLNFVIKYAYGTFTGFEFRPAQVAGLSIVTYCAVAPSLSATTVPDNLGQYAEGIACGALSRILSAKDKAYSDTAGATIAKTMWDNTIADAKADAYNGFARVKQRTALVRF